MTDVQTGDGFALLGRSPNPNASRNRLFPEIRPMKLFSAAILLAFASPAFAQANPHAGHAPAAQQGAHDAHGAHEGHGSGHGQGHEGHKDCCKDGKMPCCEKAKAAGKKMPCCEKHEAEGAKAGQGHGGHSGH